MVVYNSPKPQYGKSHRILPLRAKAGAEKLRYAEKLTLINGQDPFLLGSSGIEKKPLPPIEATDLVSYLVLQTSCVTAKQFKAHKSMEAYNQFVSGWVKEVSAWIINGKSVITGRVSFFLSFCNFLGILYLLMFR